MRNPLQWAYHQASLAVGGSLYAHAWIESRRTGVPMETVVREDVRAVTADATTFLLAHPDLAYAFLASLPVAVLLYTIHKVNQRFEQVVTALRRIERGGPRTWAFSAASVSLLASVWWADRNDRLPAWADGVVAAQTGQGNLFADGGVAATTRSGFVEFVPALVDVLGVVL